MRGQARVQPSADGVVAAGDADVIGDAQAAVAQTAVDAMGGWVIAGKDSGDRFTASQDRLTAEIADFGFVFRVDVGVARLEAGLLHGAAITLEAAGEPGKPDIADEPGMAMAQTEKVAGHVVPTLDVVGSDDIVLSHAATRR